MRELSEELEFAAAFEVEVVFATGLVVETYGFGTERLVEGRLEDVRLGGDVGTVAGVAVTDSLFAELEVAATTLVFPVTGSVGIATTLAKTCELGSIGCDSFDDADSRCAFRLSER